LNLHTSPLGFFVSLFRHSRRFLFFTTGHFQCVNYLWSPNEFEGHFKLAKDKFPHAGGSGPQGAHQGKKVARRWGIRKNTAKKCPGATVYPT
jgi:hypothetical protein